MSEQKRPVDKPLSIQRREFINELQNLINGRLDLYLVEPILVDALAMVRQALGQREVKEQAEYNKYLNESKGG